MVAALLFNWWIEYHDTMILIRHLTGGDDMAANDSFFRNQNGGSGYVLKPDYLRSVSQVPFDPSNPEDLEVNNKLKSVFF